MRPFKDAGRVDTAAGRGSSWPKLCIASALAWSANAALLAWVVAEYGLYAAGALHFPYGLDYSEGLIWQQVLWTPGPHMYGDISHYPFVVFEYPPLYLLVVKALAATGLGMLPAGRSVSVAAVLATCAMTGLMVRRTSLLAGCGGRAATLAGLLAAALPLTLLPVLSWSVLMRVDMLALALTYAGLSLALAALRRPGLIYPAVLAFVAAAFTKQIYLAGAVSVGIVWLIRSPRQAFAAYGAGGALGLAVVAGLDWQSSGGFIRHIIVYNVDRLNLAAALAHTATWLEAYPVLAGLVAVSLGVAWRRTPVRRGGPGLLACIRDDEATAMLAVLTLYLGLTTCLLISAGKIGASRNYFIEWMSAWCVWIGLLAAILLHRLGEGRREAAILGLLVPLLLALQIAPVPFGVAALRAGQFSADRQRQDAALLQRVSALRGPILSDDMVLVIQSGREVGLEPGILLELAGTGLWQEQALIDMLNRQDFSAIVTAYGPGDPTFAARYLPRTTAAMLAHYPVVESFGDYRLRLPR